MTALHIIRQPVIRSQRHQSAWVTVYLGCGHKQLLGHLDTHRATQRTMICLSCTGDTFDPSKLAGALDNINHKSPSRETIRYRRLRRKAHGASAS